MGLVPVSESLVQTKDEIRAALGWQEWESQSQHNKAYVLTEEEERKEDAGAKGRGEHSLWGLLLL